MSYLGETGFGSSDCLLECVRSLLLASRTSQEIRRR